MRRITAVLASACLALALAGAASSTTFRLADDAGNGASGVAREQAVGAGYDGLKAVAPGSDVIACGLSPRGNGDFDAPSNVSHSPIRFLKEIGDAYRQSGRTKPVADDLSVHC